MVNIITPNGSPNNHYTDNMTVIAHKAPRYFMISNDSGQTITLYKPAIPELILVLMRIYNGESV